MNLDHAAPLGLATLGLLLGMRHATDPDHVIAVTTILSRERRLSTATRVGLMWGLGHSATLVLVGSMIIIFKLTIPVRAGLAMEFAVALVLILLGFPASSTLVRHSLARLGLWQRSPNDTVVVHSHQHFHDGGAAHRHPHVHSHAHRYHALDTSLHRDHILPTTTLSRFAINRPLLRSFGVGLVHGLAGSAAIALIVLGAIPQPLWATLYLAIFSVGTIIGMGLITTAIGAPFILASDRIATVHRRLVLGSGLLSFGFGLLLAWQIGIADNLFWSTPHWVPR